MKRRQLNKEQLVNALIKKATYNDIYEREHGLEEHEYKDDTIKHYLMHEFSKAIIKKLLSNKKIEFVCKPCYESDSDNGSGRFPVLEMVTSHMPKGYSLPMLKSVEQVNTKENYWGVMSYWGY